MRILQCGGIQSRNARDDVMEAGDHLRQAVLGCFDSIFTNAVSSAARTKAEQELKALEATDGRRYF